MDLSRSIKVLFAFAVLTIALYTPHLADGFVYQDDHYAYTVSSTAVHTVSLCLHLLNGLLLYSIATKAGWPGPVWITALFWLHPLATEAVAYGAAQSELLILASLLLGVWTLQRRLWLVAIVPLLVLMTTKAGAVPSLLTNTALAEGVSFPQWWAWEATAAWRLLGLWLLPIRLSFDHDTVHVARLIQIAALVTFPLLLGFVAWFCRSARLPILWIVLALSPRFALRVPLSILNEHHWYPITPALAVITVLGWAAIWQRARVTA